MKVIIETPTASSSANLTLNATKVLRDHSGLPDRLRGWNVHIIGDEGPLIIHGKKDEICIMADMLNTAIAKIEREMN